MISCESTHLMAAEFYVSPAGSPTGNGSLRRPWDLETALDHPPVLMPGDVIWLRGGVYRKNGQVTKFESDLQGAPGQPITVRQYPGERATIDGNIMQINGGWVNYWGFEIMNSHSNRLTGESGPFPTAFWSIQNGKTNDLAVSGFDLRAPNVKLINLVIHDSIGGGIGISALAENPEIYGTISYYNGWQGCDRGHGHGIYIQNADPSSARIEDNIFYGNYALGIQATANEFLVDNLHLEGNVMFLNGILARGHQGNLLIGPATGQARNALLKQNIVFDTEGSDSDSVIGYIGGTTDARLIENYFQTSVFFSQNNENLFLASNVFLSGTLFLDRNEYPDNLYLTNAPQTNHVIIRTNKYEPGRAHIIVFNWENSAAISIDPGEFLPPGERFEIRSAQNYFGGPVLRGTYNGAPILVPLKGHPVSKPVGTNAPISAAPQFHVFVLLPSVAAPNPAPNTPPALSAIEDQVVDENTTTPPIGLTVSDAETPPEHLVLSVYSFDPQLIPHKNISFTGTGSSRSLSIHPATNQTGTTQIILFVSDGLLSAGAEFTLTVNPSPAGNPSPEEPPPAQMTPTNQFSITLTIFNQQTAVLVVRGDPGAVYDVHASPDLLDWDAIGTIVAACDGVGRFTDPEPVVHESRCYRLVIAAPPP